MSSSCRRPLWIGLLWVLFSLSVFHVPSFLPVNGQAYVSYQLSGAYNVTVTDWTQGYGYLTAVVTDGSHIFTSDFGNGAVHVLSMNGTLLYDITPSPFDESLANQPSGLGFWPHSLALSAGDPNLLFVADLIWDWINVFNLTSQEWVNRCANEFEYFGTNLYSIAMDASGNAYVSATDGNNGYIIQYLDVTGGYYCYPAATVAAVGGFSNSPVAVDILGLVYYIDSNNNQILVFDSTAALNLTNAFPFPDTSGYITLTADPLGGVYAGSFTNIVGFSANGTLTLNVAYEPGSSYRFYSQGMAVLPDGTFLFSETYGHDILHIARNGTTLAQFSSPYAAPEAFSMGIALSPNSDIIWMMDDQLLAAHITNQSLITSDVIDVDSGYGQWLAVDSTGTWLYRINSDPEAQRYFTANTTISEALTVPDGINPVGLAASPWGGFVYFLDGNNGGTLYRYNASSGEMDANYSLKLPNVGGVQDLAIDSRGRFYTCAGNGFVLRVEGNHTFNILLSPGCNRVAVDSNFTLYLATGNNVIAQNVRGEQLWTFQMDAFNSVSSLAVDAHGSVFVMQSLLGLLQLDYTLVQVTPAPTGTTAAVSLSPAPVLSSTTSPSSLLSSSVPLSPSSQSIPSSSSIAAAVMSPSLNGTLCVLLYSSPGNVDYPWSSAISVTFQYNPTPVTTAWGTGVTLLSGSGSRTYTNRFGVSFTTPLTLAPLGTSPSDNLLYLNSSIPVDSNGIAWMLSSPVQLPGQGPFALYPTLNLHNLSGVVVEATESIVDPLGSAFVSSIPGFSDVTIGASNTNSLPAQYSTCQAPITFSNGVRPPTQPSASNGALRISYAYTISDGQSYMVQGNLTITASSAFASLKDQLGNPYQILVNATGTRLYTYLPTGQQLMSNITGLSQILYSGTGADQRFYPYSLLSSGAGVYSINSAPFWDANGLEFNVFPSIPALGLPIGQGAQFNATTIYVSTTQSAAVLTEEYYIRLPLSTLQQQSYLFLQ